MFRTIKKMFAAGLTAIMFLSMVSCGETETPYLTKDGKIPSYALNEAPDGMYILKQEDKRCYVGLTRGATNVDDDSHVTTHYWLISEMEAAIPELSENDQIIIKSTSERPSEYNFIKLEDYGYTVGTSFTVIEDTTDIKSPVIITFGDDLNPASPIGGYLDSKIATGHNSNENVKITSINGKEMTVNMLTMEGYLRGLTKDGMYTFTYYEGTKYNDIMIKADSHLFYASNVYESSIYAEMEDDYFVVAPSPEMTSGYYYLESYGMFYYDGESKMLSRNSDVKAIEGNATEAEESENGE